MNPLLFTPRRRIAAALWLSLGIAGAALAQPQPPLAERAPKALTAHGETRTDDYYWLRDDSRKEPKVLDYLKAENRYTEQMMAPYQKLRATLYQEMLGRMNPDDRSVPYQLNGYRYQESYAAGKDFALYQRRALTADAPWQTLLDANQRAAGHAYYRPGRWMSAGQPPAGGGRRSAGPPPIPHLLREIGSERWSPETLENTSGNMVWANDSQTLFYVRNHPQTLLPYRSIAISTVRRRRKISWCTRKTIRRSTSASAARPRAIT